MSNPEFEKTQEIPRVKSYEEVFSLEELLPLADESQLYWFIAGCRHNINELVETLPCTEENRLELKGFADALRKALIERDRRKITGPVYGFES